MQGVGSLPPESPTTNSQQSPNNNVVLPPKPQHLPHPTSFRQKKPPMPSPPPTTRMDPEVSKFTRILFFTFIIVLPSYTILFMFLGNFLFNLFAVRTFFFHV